MWRVGCIRVLARSSIAVRGPKGRPRDEFVADLRPVVKHRRIEIGAVRPHECARFWIKGDSVELAQVPQRAKEGTLQYWLEIDTLIGAVAEDDAQRVRRDDRETGDAMDCVVHVLT